MTGSEIYGFGGIQDKFDSIIPPIQ